MVTPTSSELAAPAPLVIDCACCELQHSDACRDCVVTYLCEREPGEAVVIQESDVAALRLLHQGGLAPALRHRRRTG